MHPIGLIVKNVPEAQKTADHLETWLTSRGAAVARIQPDESEGGQSAALGPERQLACLFVLGGDGTFLSAVRWIGEAPIPILGVKFGEVGFLAEIAAEDLFAAAESVLQNAFEIQTRMRLAVAVIRSGTECCRESVLNDVGIRARRARVPVLITTSFRTASLATRF